MAKPVRMSCIAGTPLSRFLCVLVRRDAKGQRDVMSLIKLVFVPF